jgi:uncharacterized protein (UPF0335 family)
MTVNKKLNDEELEAIRKRVEDTSFESVYVKGDPWKGYEVRDNGNGIVVAETHTKVDAEFIAHAREDVPKLLAEIERLNAELEKANQNTKDIVEELFGDKIRESAKRIADDLRKKLGDPNG